MTAFYARLRENRKDDDDLAACIERVVNQLEDVQTTSDRPGMLLGKIQSGKTRAFVGVIARAFDHGFDIAVVLTKGTKTLSAQTVARLSRDFKEFIDEDALRVLDIMRLPGRRLTGNEQRRKLVIVAKKQGDNLRRLHEFFDELYPELKERRVILIDDEADLASVRFVRTRDNPEVEQGKIAERMDGLRRIVEKMTFLQVTATPYSLYLQPESYQNSDEEEFVFKPKKPAFTELLPIHGGYVGGDDYFLPHEESDPRSFLIVEVQRDEQDALRREDGRRIRRDRVLESSNASGLVRALCTFILGACVRRWQQANAGEKPRKYAMIVHNDTQRAAHAWQDQVIEWISESLTDAASNDVQTLRRLFEAAYNDLSASVRADRGRMPQAEEAFELFVEAFQGDHIVRQPVNSDQDVMPLLDEASELKLETPYNIFIGGNILDRGITVPNLIAFYYGRNPKMMQADTVLQHSRMYGNRDRRDLAVTRFHTSNDVLERLYTINAFENALREAFESGAHEQGVVFIQTDANRRVRPCAPNKVLLSNVVAIKPNGLYLPTGFQTRPGSDMKKTQREIEELIPHEARNRGEFFEVDQEVPLKIIALIEKTLEFADSDFDWNALRGLLDYYSDVREGGNRKVLLMAETGRELNQEKSGDKSGVSILGTKLRKLAADPSRTRPALILLQQKGSKKDLGWSGDYPFWWPVLAAPGTVEPCIFATKVATN